MKKSLFIAFERNLSSLPPLLTQIELLNEIYDTTVSVAKVESEFVERYPNVKFISYYNWIEPKKKLDKVINRINRSYSFPRFVKRYLKNNRPNLFWIGSAEAAFLLKPIEKYIANIPYNLNIYELYDRKPIMLKRIKKIAQNAEQIIVPEYNRANILRLWLGLKETPIVIPNKPIFHPRKRNLPIPPDLQSKMEGKKIILYQGHITSDRNIDILCETIQELPDFQLVLLGDGGGYLESLKKRYSTIIHIDFVKPPMHLNITSWAYIGIVSYEYYSLNTIYCAPNKIWEYSGFGIPMLANDIPGLRGTVDRNSAGVCFNVKSKEQIKENILMLENNYAVYSNNAIHMFDNENIVSKIYSIIEKDE